MRYHGLDALRSFAMLLGVLLHSMLFFQIPELMQEVRPGSDVVPSDATPAAWALSLWIHIWRMPLFFILAGFFAELVIARKGLRAFLTDRSIRILGALLVFLTLFGVLIERNLMVLDHLWFLWFLALFSGLLCVWHAIGMRVPVLGPRMFWGMVGAAVTLAGALRVNGFWHRIPELLSDFEWRGFILYGCYFVLGLLLYHRRDQLEVLARRSVHILLLGAGVLAFAALAWTLRAPWSALTIAPLSGLATGALAFGMIGVCQAWITRPNPWIAWGVKAAYPVYIFHLYPLLLIASAMIEAGYGQWSVVAGATLGGFVAAVLHWYILVRYTPLDWLVNGYRNAWFKWPFARNGTRVAS